MDKNYVGSIILALESEAHSRPSQFALPFSPFMVDLTFGKILNIREQSQ